MPVLQGSGEAEQAVPVGCLLQEWIRQAEQDAPKPMKGFASFLRQDLDAVTAGLTLPWSSGVVEGHVNRVKTPKLAMDGRALFELLRTRILPQSSMPPQRAAGSEGGLALHAGEPQPGGHW
ncbi:hypothetical protein SMA5143A_8271 [Streptomyces sp. MA5143a]|nr:hypothetical protein SMA5143A_8271 [Streptomyces sp. MA5143a]